MDMSCRLSFLLRPRVVFLSAGYIGYDDDIWLYDDIWLCVESEGVIIPYRDIGVLLSGI